MPNHYACSLSPLNLDRIRALPDGGRRTAWSDELRLDCHAELKGYTDTYGRMSWDRPAPALTTRCISLSNGRYGQPEQDRAISIREASNLQSFAENFVFVGTVNGMARQIGNAVPPELARVCGSGGGLHLGGETYPSLTAVAQKITGAHWSGPRFFGLLKKLGRPLRLDDLRRSAIESGQLRFGLQHRRGLQLRTPSEDPGGPHALRLHLQTIGNRAGSFHPQSDPVNTGTEQLAFQLLALLERLLATEVYALSAEALIESSWTGTSGKAELAAYEGPAAELRQAPERMASFIGVGGGAHG